MTSSPSSKIKSLASDSPPQTLSKREIKWGWALLLTFVALVSLPYLWCALLTPPGFTWGGLFFSADDQNVHLMWAKQAEMGSFFIRDLFTTEGLVSGNKPLFFNLYPLMLGLLARLSHVDLIVWYHISRVAFAGLFVWQLHRLLVTATGGAPDKENVRLGALALATLTTGSGFVLVAAHRIGWRPNIISVDYPTLPGFPNMPEAYALSSALIYPLNIASFALLCFLLRSLIEAPTSWRKLAKVFVGALVLSNIHTYDALPLLVACIVGLAAPTISVIAGILFRRGKMAKHKEWKWRIKEVQPTGAQLRVWGAVFLGLVLPVLYQAIVFRGSEEFRVKALTPTSPPQIWHIAASFAPLILLALWGWKAKWVAGTQKWLWIYAASVLLLVYAPKTPALLPTALFGNSLPYGNFYLFSFARKMIEGFQVPLLVFAGAGMAALPRRRILAPIVIFICIISPLSFWRWALDNASGNNNGRAIRYLMPRYYLTNAEAGALEVLAKAPDKNVAVLCTPVLGSYVPRTTGLYTYTGHWAETLHIRLKNPEVRRFYGGEMSLEEARAFLKTNHIRYVVESPFERGVGGSASSTASQLDLKRIYGPVESPEGPVSVFEVEE